MAHDREIVGPESELTDDQWMEAIDKELIEGATA